MSAASEPGRPTAIALNTDRVGHRYPSYRYEVSREKIREYVRATAHDAAYLSDDADLVAPPMFAACFAGIREDGAMDDPELNAHWNLVHGSQEFTFHRPVRVGDVLECTPVIADISNRGGMDFMTVRTECVDADSGDDVVTAAATLIFLGD